VERKIKLLIEYEGSAYHGWQFQSNGITVQEVLEKCIQKTVKQKTTVYSSSRTDAGVHAEGMVAHFTSGSNMTEGEFMRALNSLLPHDIVIKEVSFVSMKFDSRRSAGKKIYRYTILNRDYPSALLYRRCLFVPFPLNVSAMRRARNYLVGRHDFTSFRAANCGAKSPVREIYKIDLLKKGDFIYLIFEGGGFLKHMVRNMVGTLVQVGRDKIQASDVKLILESKDRQKAGPTAEPQGLCLVKVEYPIHRMSRGKKKSEGIF
jgi:tRNA pseudouridine38-40 synthase